ncbi:hypothetical protein F2Q70_00034574 [Brassica cretica]|uniref:Uncharacterized protein n=1 Tax=Brassica cretica TaxID=69181 RepID=A0A8S9JW59_BRACR|nr:hypothetical protein F2Q70_00034574 [Brassica cretica]
MNTGQDEEPLPSTGTIGGDRTPPTVKTNHGRTNLRKDPASLKIKISLKMQKPNQLEKRIVGDVGEVGAMKVVASRRQSGTVIGGTDQPSETRTGRKYRNRLRERRLLEACGDDSGGEFSGG